MSRQYQFISYTQLYYAILNVNKQKNLLIKFRKSTNIAMRTIKAYLNTRRSIFTHT